MATFWNYPTRIRFGAGEAWAAGDEAVALGASRVLIVTDGGVASTGLLEPIATALREAKLAVSIFSGISPNPVEPDIALGVEAFRAADANLLVAVGGGSPIDGAKLIATRLATKRPFEELDDAIGGDRHIPRSVTPIIALPTTAGTGSEVGRSGVITLASSGRKTVIFSPALLPKVAILDPELCVGLPAQSTAATGFDALTHCLEALVARGDHPMADGIALEGLRLIQRSLRKAVAEPKNLDARGDMLKAAMMGAVAFQKGLGACHSMAHPLSSELGLHHGLANALCLPAVVRFNRPAVTELFARVAEVLGAPGEDLADVLVRFRAEIGLPARLQEQGVTAQHLPQLARLAMLDACHLQNPIACDESVFLRLFKEAL
jgi:4-hydroxybutyrate dehydrogenase